MLIDANDLGDGANLTTDLCIIGAGAAGVAIADAFKDSSVSILLLESGGLSSEDATQALYEGSYGGNVPGITAAYLRSSRLRQYGGTTNFWGGYCRPLDASDFEQRGWVANSGWPITRADLDPYYRAASSFLGLEAFDEKPLISDDPAFAPQFGGPLDERVYQFRYVNIGADHLDAFKASSQVTLLLHANVTQLATTAQGRAVDHVEIATLGGKRFQARARAFILATGGIENARLLLANGIGNGHDLVGRYFMEHAIVPIGLHCPAFIWQSVSLKRYRPADATGSPVGPTVRQAACLVGIAEAVASELGLLNITADLTWAIPPGTFEFTEFEQALIRASHNLDEQCSHSPDELPAQEIRIGFVCEHAPNPNSRVKLTADRDPLGVPRIELDWQIGELELDTAEAFARLFSAEIANRRLGRMRIPDRGEIRPWIAGGHHHMGTTRMHADPTRGVVDANCRVHGVDNLFVAGSSVFATSGAANPTFTLLALALRLAEHLRGLLS